MAQYNLDINGTRMNVIDTLGNSQPLGHAALPQPWAQSVPNMASNGFGGAADFKNLSLVTGNYVSDRT